MRDRLVELLQNFADGTVTGNGTIVDRTKVEDVADFLLANDVIVPPCKVGDKVYQVDGVRIYESTIDEINYTARTTIYYTNGIAFDDRAIGESIFLTKEEAEKSLKGDEGNEQKRALRP